MNLLTVNADGTYKLNYPDNYPVKIYHIVPNGITVTNIGNLNGASTIYYSDPVSNRQFNIGFLRGGDLGGRVVVVVRDYTALTIGDILYSANTLTGTTSKRMVTTTAAYYMWGAGIEETGWLTENTDMTTAMNSYKTALTDGGYTYS